jgi:hypothetical protein
MTASWRRAGLVDIEETGLAIRMEHADFADYWAPIAAGEGPYGKYVAALPEAPRLRFEAALRSAYEAGRADGPRSFAAIALACKGRVPV